MSAIGAVIENFEEAQKAESEQNFLRAARYYRRCALYYENGELPVYDSRVAEYGRSTPSHYESCKAKLTRKAQRMLYRCAWKVERQETPTISHDSALTNNSTPFPPISDIEEFPTDNGVLPF